jgi:predicted MFS family arabinose efflux permease
MFFLTAIYLQQVRADSALEAGVHFLPMGGAAIVGALLASQLVQRVGTRTVQLAGAVLSVVGLLYLSQADAAGSYSSELLPGLIIFGFGIIGVGVPGQITAVSEVRPAEAGAASGVVNAMYQVGGALGLAIVTTLSITHTTNELTHGATQLSALQSGFQRGLLVAALFAVANVLLTLAAPQLQPTSEQLAEATAAA